MLLSIASSYCTSFKIQFLIIYCPFDGLFNIFSPNHFLLLKNAHVLLITSLKPQRSLPQTVGEVINQNDNWTLVYCRNVRLIYD